MSTIKEKFQQYCEAMLQGLSVDDQRYIDAERAFYAGNLASALQMRDEMRKAETVAVGTAKAWDVATAIIGESNEMLMNDKRPTRVQSSTIAPQELRAALEEFDELFCRTADQGAAVDALSAMLLGHIAIKMFRKRRKQVSAGAIHQIVNAFIQDVRERAKRAPAIN